jgi:hypothetical protein
MRAFLNSLTAGPHTHAHARTHACMHTPTHSPNLRLPTPSFSGSYTDIYPTVIDVGASSMPPPFSACLSPVFPFRGLLALPPPCAQPLSLAHNLYVWGSSHACSLSLCSHMTSHLPLHVRRVSRFGCLVLAVSSPCCDRLIAEVGVVIDPSQGDSWLLAHSACLSSF